MWDPLAIFGSMSTSAHRQHRSGIAVSDPGVITAAEWDAAMGFAAADAAVFDADFGRLSARERQLVVALEDDYDAGQSLPGPELHRGPRTSPRPATANRAAVSIATASWPRMPSSVRGSRRCARTGSRSRSPGGWRWPRPVPPRVTTRELLAIAEAAPGSLGVPDQPGLGVVGDSITQLRCIDRLSAFLAARRHTVIGALCPPEDRYRAEQHLVEELQVAARVGPGVAHRDIEAARLLAGPFARSHHDLAAGQISDAHTRVLIFETRNVRDDPTPTPTSPRANAARVGPRRNRRGVGSRSSRRSRTGSPPPPAVRRPASSRSRCGPRSARSMPRARPTGAPPRRNPRRERGPGQRRHGHPHRP